MEGYLNVRKDSVIFYKVNLLLDVEFDDDAYSESTKLNSFFGQIGVYENSERLISLVSNLYNDLYFNFLIIKEESDIKEDVEDLKMFFNPEHNIFNENDDIESVFNNEQTINFEYYEEDIVYESNLEEQDKEENEEDFGESYFRFFLPLIMVFYRGDRKMDYYLGNEFKEKLFFKKKTIVFKEKFHIKNFLKKPFFLKINYKINCFLKKFYKNKKNFFNMVKNNNVVFIDKDFLKYHFFDIKKKTDKKKKKRFKMFKKLKLKARSKMLYLLKDNKWWSEIYLLCLLNLKFFFLSNYYSHKNYLSGIFNFFSQMINIKKKFFRRYRRKRRFKKNFFRNFFGKRAKLNVILNILEEDKKKGKKGKKR